MKPSDSPSTPPHTPSSPRLRLQKTPNLQQTKRAHSPLAAKPVVALKEETQPKPPKPVEAKKSKAVLVVPLLGVAVAAGGAACWYGFAHPSENAAAAVAAAETEAAPAAEVPDMAQPEPPVTAAPAEDPAAVGTAEPAASPEPEEPAPPIVKQVPEEFLHGVMKTSKRASLPPASDVLVYNADTVAEEEKTFSEDNVHPGEGLLFDAERTDAPVILKKSFTEESAESHLLMANNDYVISYHDKGFPVIDFWDSHNMRYVMSAKVDALTGGPRAIPDTLWYRYESSSQALALCLYHHYNGMVVDHVSWYGYDLAAGQQADKDDIRGRKVMNDELKNSVPVITGMFSTGVLSSSSGRLTKGEELVFLVKDPEYPHKDLSANMYVADYSHSFAEHTAPHIGEINAAELTWQPLPAEPETPAAPDAALMAEAAQMLCLKASSLKYEAVDGGYGFGIRKGLFFVYPKKYDSLQSMGCELMMGDEQAMPVCLIDATNRKVLRMAADDVFPVDAFVGTSNDQMVPVVVRWDSNGTMGSAWSNAYLYDTATGNIHKLAVQQQGEEDYTQYNTDEHVRYIKATCGAGKQVAQSGTMLNARYSEGSETLWFVADPGICTLYKVSYNGEFADPVYNWNGQWGDRDNPGVGGPVWLPEKKWLCIPVTENSWEIFKIENGSETPRLLAYLYLHSGRQYAFVLPNGHYAGTPGCESFLYAQENDSLISMEVFAPWRNRPAEVAVALGGTEETYDVFAAATNRWLSKLGYKPDADGYIGSEPRSSSLPQAQVDAPNVLTDEARCSFTLRVKAPSGIPSRAEIRVDGALVAETDEVPAGRCAELTQEVPLALGTNWIEVTPVSYVNGVRVAGETARFRTICSVGEESELYVVTLGVSEYEDASLRLQYAAKDARDMAECFRTKGMGKVHALCLTDGEVRHDTALQKISDFLSSARPGDRIVCYVAGHGLLDEKLDYYYAPVDIDAENVAATGISMDALTACLQQQPARQRLLLLDTCHSGVLGEEGEEKMALAMGNLPPGVRAVQHRGMKVKKVAPALNTQQKKRYIETLFSMGKSQRGLNIIAGAAGAEFALESTEWNNGVFTASVMEAMQQTEKADKNQDGALSVSELVRYAAEAVSARTNGAQKPALSAMESPETFLLSAGAASAGAAVSAGLSALKRLRAQGIEDLEERDAKGNTPLLKATADGNSELVKLLVEAGADVNARNAAGDAPLMNAACCGDAESVKLLYEHHADVNAQDKDGWNALMLAINGGHEQLADTLWITYEADPEATAKNGVTAYQLAKKKGMSNLALKLANVTGVNDNSTYTPPASSNTRSSTPSYSSNGGATDFLPAVNSYSDGGSNGLYKKRLNMLLPMIANGSPIDVTTVETKGNTALHYACGLGADTLVEWLLQHGANPNAITNKGVSPLQSAGKDSTRNILRRYGAQ